MLKRLARELRMIRYYSANRRRSPWQRVKDALLVLALPLAVPAILMAEQLVQRPVALEEVEGEMSRLDDGSVLAALKQSDTAPWMLPGAPYGEFELELRRTELGWPLTSQQRLEGIQLDLHLFTETKTRRNATLPDDSPVRSAIEAVLREDDHTALLRAWQTPGGAEQQRVWFGSIFGVTLWWIMLTFAMFLVTSVVQFFVMVHRSQRQSRQSRLLAEGKCHVCGYDMRGLEFNERCPECGSLVR
jgi:hypothetical protein